MNDIRQPQKSKNRFRELFDHVLSTGLQIVTRRGKKVATIVPDDEFEILAVLSKGLVNLLLTYPFACSGLEITRDSSTPRNIELK